ncbi:hypothetical protein P7F88_25220 [Vibrio hannami]|uniref:hypothetical protein n=1 Tax=Vibrio hannami TaxID=2717094 RepID=UPI0024103365|nr:hypothetical protein [Vibrio hannami]MDG3089166.1 hypothetical protein [Vibrio hannami]
MTNIEKLLDRLNSENPGMSKKFTNADIAEVLGYGRTQIFDAVKKQKEPARLVRACEMANHLMDLGGNDALFRYMSKMDVATSASLTEYVDKKVSKALDQISIDEAIENNAQHFGFENPLTLDMLKEDIQNGYITEASFTGLTIQLTQMFGYAKTYEFAQVKAALVAVVSPEMVKKPIHNAQCIDSDDTSLEGFRDVFRGITQNLKTATSVEKVLLRNQVHELAHRLISEGVLPEHDYVFEGINNHNSPALLLNRRKLRRFLEELRKESPENEQKNEIKSELPTWWPENIDPNSMTEKRLTMLLSMGEAGARVVLENMNNE